MGALRIGPLFVKPVVMLAPSPRVFGYVPCGACTEFVMKCPHYKPMGGRVIQRPVPSGVDSVRRNVVIEARGRCQTCDRQALVLHVRCVSQTWYRGKMRADNAIAVCAMCRTQARGISIKAWVDSGSSPQTAKDLIQARSKAGLPV